MNSFRTKSVIFVILQVFSGLSLVHAQDFTYDGSLGPEHWGEQYNGCDGKYQSPINIDMLNVQKTVFPPLVFKGFDEPAESANLLNNGHTVVVTMNFDEQPTLAGGPLNSTYRFAQFHFHWGDNDTYGSEDRINDQSYPVELHMVFFNEAYQEYNNALKYPNGVVVLAFFYSVSEEENPHYYEFTMLLDKIVEPDISTPFLNPPTMRDLISSNVEKYFTYIGSLTTPPCSEVVTWLDFAVPISISTDQIQKFRNLNSHNGPLTHNFRPVQPLNGRIIYENVLAGAYSNERDSKEAREMNIEEENAVDEEPTPETPIDPRDRDILLEKNKRKKFERNSNSRATYSVGLIGVLVALIVALF